MKSAVIAIMFFLIDPALGQSVEGITGIPDTSYNQNSAYRSSLSTHPRTKMVKVDKSPGVKEDIDVIYCRQGNRVLATDVFYPSEEKQSRKTALVLIHGGGWRSGNRTMFYSMARKLAAAGYTCFTPEYRLSTEALYPAGLYDIKSVIRWVRSQAHKYGFDTGRVVVAGHSAGGELAAMAGATNYAASFEGDGCSGKYSSAVNAVIDMDGILAFIHPESGEGDDSRHTSAATYWFGFSKQEKPALWKEGSPLTHAGPQTPPILFINSSVERMHAGREDFIKVLDHFNIHSEVFTFDDSPHSFPLFDPWFDSTVTVMVRFMDRVFEKQAATRVWIVAKDGSGNFTTVQQALEAVPLQNNREQLIFIRSGIYKEKLRLDSTKNFVTLLGEDKFKTILTYNDHSGKISPAGDTINTRSSWSFKIKADSFTAENLSFQNEAGFTAGQAVAVESDGDMAVFRNCRFTGNQDVLFTNSERSRQYFENCYIEGTTDFIFGSSTVWFENCHIHSKKNSHITAASTPADKEFGYIFNNCILTGDSSLHNVSLGRPWRPYASVLYMNSYMGAHIKPEGWSNWNNTDNYKTARYAEYKNYGPSSDTTKRLNWSRQLTEDSAGRITIRRVFNGWDPSKQ